MEDSLKDSRFFTDFLFPRTLRLTLLAFLAVSSFVVTIIGLRLAYQDYGLAAADGTWANVALDSAACALFTGLFVWDWTGRARRKSQRERLKRAQITFGDREAYVNERGQRMTRLKEVDYDWILRRLERWGKKEGMPFIGPQKAQMLAQLVQQQQPMSIVEVGTMCGYSALKLALAAPPRCRVISIEKDLLWWLAAKRFVWQAGQGEAGKKLPVQERLQNKIDVRWGEAQIVLPKLAAELSEQVDFLFLDGTPKETLEYLKAAEPLLRPGAVVTADNAGVFREGGMKPFLEYIHESGRYKDVRLDNVMLEWRPDIEDAIAVTTYTG